MSGKSSKDEDARLAAELRAKVDEIYGGNSKSRVKTSEETEVNVYEIKKKEEHEVKQAWIVVVSVAAFSVLAAMLFVGLWAGGYVHGKEKSVRTYPIEYEKEVVEGIGEMNTGVMERR